jgi:hypothetical protein
VSKKDISNFYKKGDSTRPECKSCTNEKHKLYKSKNRDFINKLKRDYHNSENGKKVNKIYSEEYRKNLPEYVRDKLKISHRDYCKNRYNNDTLYRLGVSIRNLIGLSFR